MSKVKLTIIKDSPAALQMSPTSIIQEVCLDAARYSDSISATAGNAWFQFGNAVVYTHGVQAFIFEDIEE